MATAESIPSKPWTLEDDFYQVKDDIIAVLKKNDKFKERFFNGSDEALARFDLEVRFLDYFNYADERCLKIYIDVPDASFASLKEENLKNYFKNVVDPIMEEIINLETVKNIRSEYKVFSIYFEEKGRLDKGRVATLTKRI